MTKLLSDAEIDAGLAGLPGWARHGQAIGKDYKFPGFPDAVAFVARIVGPAEALNHHPDLEVHYNRVAVRVSTHSEGGVTGLDLTLAGQIDEAAAG